MRVFVALLAALATISSYGQEATIHTTVPLVVLPTSVTDSKGHFIEGLSVSDFLLLDDGISRPVRVDVTDSELAPVALVAVIQTSNLSTSALGKIRKVGAMISEAVVGANGEAAVVTFADRINIAQDFTADADAISQCFRDLKPAADDGGRMMDAVEASLQMLAKRPEPQRSNILIISESKDRGSKTKLQDLVSTIQRTGVTIYSLSYSAYLTPFTTRASEYSPSPTESALFELARLAKKNTVEALTRETGGIQMRFETKAKLENDLIRLGSEIHSRYVISFTPDLNQTPSFHRLEVHIKTRPDAIVRTRQGYWTGPQASDK